MMLKRIFVTMVMILLLPFCFIGFMMTLIWGAGYCGMGAAAKLSKWMGTGEW